MINPQSKQRSGTQGAPPANDRRSRSPVQEGHPHTPRRTQTPIGPAHRTRLAKGGFEEHSRSNSGKPHHQPGYLMTDIPPGQQAAAAHRGIGSMPPEIRAPDPLRPSSKASPFSKYVHLHPRARNGRDTASKLADSRLTDRTLLRTSRLPICISRITTTKPRHRASWNHATLRMDATKSSTSLARALVRDAAPPSDTKNPSS